MFRIPELWFLYLQGEALRQSLLTRYYGKTHPRMRRESAGAGPSSQTTGPGGGIPGSGGAGPGSVMLSRAEMTLAEVQVGSHFPISYFLLLYHLYYISHFEMKPVYCK